MRMTEEQIAERDARYELIASHIAASTCYMCGQVVEMFAPKHGPTGAHWECHREPFEAMNRYMDEVNPLRKDPTPRMARANGGSLVHIVVPMTNTSLCGHKPKDTAYRMKQRGKWLFYSDAWEPRPHQKICPKCQAVAVVKYPPVEGEDDG